MSYLDTYRTPAACFKKVPVRRETPDEMHGRRMAQIPMMSYEPDYFKYCLDKGKNRPAFPGSHEGPISRIETPVRREYYTRSTGGKRVRKAKKRKF